MGLMSRLRRGGGGNVKYPRCPACSASGQWRTVGAPRNRYLGPGTVRATRNGHLLGDGHYIIQRYACSACGFRGDLVAIRASWRGRVKALDIF